MQRLCIFRLIDQYLSEVFVYLNVYLSLYLYFIVYHALDELKLALAVLQLSSFNVERLCLLEVLLYSKSFFVAFSQVKECLAVFELSCSLQVLNSSFNVGAFYGLR